MRFSRSRLARRPELPILLLVGALVTAGGAAATQQQSGDQNNDQQRVFGANVELATLSVAVLGSDGLPIADLRPEDFAIREDGVERDVSLLLTPTEAPLDVALVLDLSGSMETSGWRQRSQEFLGSLSPRKDCVLLMGFSGSVGTSIWGRPDNPAIAAAIERSQTGGATALYDALVEAIQQLVPHASSVEGASSLGTNLSVRSQAASGSGCPAPPRPADDPSSRRRKAVVVLTDGMDRSSGHNMHQVQMVAQAAAVPIFQIELPGGGRTSSIMRQTPRRLPSVSIPVGTQRRGGFGAGGGRGRLVDFQRLVDASGGDTLRAGSNAYQELLTRLRGFYVVGYYVPREEQTTPAEYTRHEVDVDLRGRKGKTLHQPVVYRPTFDPVRAQSEFDEGIRQLELQQPQAALFAFERSIEAHPFFAAALAYKAQVLDWTDRLPEALVSALQATRLDPGNAEFHQLAADLASVAGDHEVAWEHAIRAAQAGAEMLEVFEALAKQSPVPADLAERLEAPRIAVLGAPAAQPNLLVRAALPKAIRAARLAFSEASDFALVTDPRRADHLLWIVDKSISDKPPRKFKGEFVLADLAGEVLWEKGFTLDNVDDPEQNAVDLASHLGDIRRKLAPGNSRPPVPE